MNTTDTINGTCLNCGERAYQKGDHSARHAGSDEIGCNSPTIGTPGVCAVLTNE